MTTVDETYHLTDEKHDILSHPKRRNHIHVLTLDPFLGTDVEQRLSEDGRLSGCTVIRPRTLEMRSALEEIKDMAKDTVRSRLLIFDVRRITLPKLRRAFNAIVGYNRRDFNNLCYTLCIGDGPVTLFQNGNGLDAFVGHLSAHRVDYYPAAFFYDPLLHYEANELEIRGIDEDFVIPDEIPRRLVRHLRHGDPANVDRVRRFFRATDQDESARKRRQRMLRRLYRRQLAEQFPDREDELKRLLSRDGVQLVTEKLHLYPFYFEDWVVRLMRRARRNATASAGDVAS